MLWYIMQQPQLSTFESGIWINFSEMVWNKFDQKFFFLKCISNLSKGQSVVQMENIQMAIRMCFVPELWNISSHDNYRNFCKFFSYSLTSFQCEYV